MPRTIDLFLDSDQPLDQLAARLSELIGRPFVPAPDSRHFVLQDGPVVAHLSDHDFIDDDGLPLSEFRYVLSTTVPRGTSPESSQELSSLRDVRARLTENGELPCLLVIDLERPDAFPGPGACP